jgi:DNA-directed RNA polymerase subunit RPC12/RpoP
VCVVPDNSDKIKFHCESCGQSISVPQIHAGKKGKCPKCKNIVVVPSLKKELADSAGTFRIICSMCEETIEVPETSRGQAIECPGCGSHVEASSGGVPPESSEPDPSISSSTDEDQYEEEYEEPQEGAGMDRRLILIISGVAAVVVVGLIILVAVLRPSPPRQQEEVVNTSEILTQLELDEVQKFVERYIGLLENGEIDEALQLHNPGFGQRKSVIENYSRQIGIRRITRMDCQRTRCEPHLEENHILLWYNLRYERGGQAVILSVIQIGQELTIDGIAIWSISRRSTSAGPKTLDALSAAATAASTAASEKTRSFFSKFFCGFAIVILVLGIVYIVSWWIVFKKAGYPGWASIVPFYNVWVLAEIGGYSGWLGLLMCFIGFIPFVGGLIGFVLSIIISIGVARAFDRSTAFGIGLAFLPIIFYPILAFTKD